MRFRLPIVVAVVVFATYSHVPIFAEWTAPENAKPLDVLKESQADRLAGRYADALAKQLWFHAHAIDHDPYLLYVRRGTGFENWAELAKVYKPAMDALMNKREELRAGLDKATEEWLVVNHFLDYQAINQKMGDETPTVNLFMSLHEKNPVKAYWVYRYAEPTLVELGKLALCGDYIRPKEVYERESRTLNNVLALPKDAVNAEAARDETRVSFANKIATMIALLVINDRVDEAKQYARKAEQDWIDPYFYRLIGQALEGHVPRQLTSSKRIREEVAIFKSPDGAGGKPD